MRVLPSAGPRPSDARVAHAMRAHGARVTARAAVGGIARGRRATALSPRRAIEPSGEAFARAAVGLAARSRDAGVADGAAMRLVDGDAHSLAARRPCNAVASARIAERPYL